MSEESDQSTDTESASDAGDDPEPSAVAADLGALERRVEDFEADLEAAETEADLDDLEGALESAQESLETVELPDPPEAEDDEEEDPPDPYADERERKSDLEDALDDVESGIEDQRGPYAEDVVADVEEASETIESTRWAEEGHDELRAVVAEALESINEVMGTSLTLAEDESLVDRLVATLERVGTEIDEADYHPDDDAETIDALFGVTDALQDGVDDATAWNDLEVREQLRREGFYDVLDHVKDFPPELHALKVHEKRGNVDQVLLALDSLDSNFMEEHCLEALKRMGSPEATDAMLQRAGRRDKDAIEILGKIGEPDDEVVETMLDYVDAGDLTLRTATFRALGEVGAREAVAPIAQQLVADEPSVRSQAARALGLIGDTRAIEPLSDVLADDEDDTVRASAAWALTQIGTATARSEVAAYRNDPVYLVQVEAERAG